MQTQLQEPGRVNAVFRAAHEIRLPWHPQLADYGIRVDQSPQGYIDITSERLIFAPAVERAIVVQLHGLDVQPALTYLANSITLAGREVPYSTITAIDFQDQPPLGPFLSVDGKPVPKLGDEQIALNDWAAERLKAKVGDQLAVTYYEPESTTGLLQERTVKLKLAAIIRLAGAAADRRLTPTVRGLTDKATIEDWDLPFRAQAGPYQDGRRPLLAAIRRHAQGFRFVDHGPKTVGKPLRPDDLAPRRSPAGHDRRVAGRAVGSRPGRAGIRLPSGQENGP